MLLLLLAPSLCPCAARQKYAVAHLLHNLEPELFPEETHNDAWCKGKELDILCVALRAPLDAPLPSGTHEIGNTVSALTAVIHQHYRATGKPLPVPKKTPDQLLDGVLPTGWKQHHLRARPEA